MRFRNVLVRPWGPECLIFHASITIVDAERHRRTPGTPVTWSKVIESKKSANIGDAGAAKNWKRIPKSSKYNWNSYPNQGCVADAFLNRFGAVLECQMVDFGSQNHKNITEMVSGINPKSIKTFQISPKRRPKSIQDQWKYRSCVADAFWYRFWRAPGRQNVQCADLDGPSLATIFHHNSKNGIQKGIQKSMPKKYRKLMPKGVQNDVKMDVPNMILVFFLRKADFSKMKV